MTIDQQKEYYKQQIIRNNARSIAIRNYFTQRNIDTVLAYINAGGNPATDPEISKVYVFSYVRKSYLLCVCEIPQFLS